MNEEANNEVLLDVPNNEVLVENQNPIMEPVNNKKNKKYIVIVAIALFIILGVVLFFSLTSKEKVFKNNVNNIFTYLSNNLEDMSKKSIVFNTNNKAIGLEGKFNMSSNIKNEMFDLTKLSKYELNYNGVLDISNNKASFGIGLNKDKQEVISLSSYIYDTVMLLKSEKISPSIFKIDLEEEINLEDIELQDTIDYENMNKLIIKVNEITIKNIDNSKIIKDEVDSLTRLSYELDVDKYINDIIVGFQNDKEIMDILKKMYDIDKEDLDEELKQREELNSLISGNNVEKKSNIINIELYLEKFTNKLKKIVLKDKTDTRLEIDVDKDNYKFTLLSDNKKILDGEYNHSAKSFNVKIEEEDFSMTIDIKKIDNNNSEVNVKGKFADTIIDLNIKAKYETDSETIIFDFNYSDNTKGKNNYVKASNEIKITNNATVKELDAKNAKNVDDFTYTERREIEDKLTDIFEPIYDEIVVYNPYSYYDDYYNDYYNSDSNYNYNYNSYGYSNYDYDSLY